MVKIWPAVSYGYFPRHAWMESPAHPLGVARNGLIQRPFARKFCCIQSVNASMPKATSDQYLPAIGLIGTLQQFRDFAVEYRSQSTMILSRG
jgi:hypothetical protein